MLYKPPIHLPHLTISLTLLLCAGCPQETSTERDAGTRKVPEHCHAPSRACYEDCFKRETTTFCTSCCFDQLVLCDGGEAYAFDKCKQER